MKKIILSVIVLTTLLASNISQATKIAYVNIEALLATLPQIQKASVEIKLEFSTREKEVIKLSKTLQTRVDIFKKNKDTMIESKVKKEINSLIQLESELKSKSEQLKTDIRAKNEAVLQVVQKRINDAINLIAKRDNFDLILYQKIAYVSDRSNITALISDQLKEGEQ